MKVNKSYWESLSTPPLVPTDTDVDIYKMHMLPGSTLLLGCTKKLLSLSDVQMDIDPWYMADTVRIQDWTTNTETYTNILVDGGLNLFENLTESVLNMAKANCSTLIARCFNYRLPTMKVATYFPGEHGFVIPPTITIKFEEYSFYIWRF